ncbi:hypothetical protein [Pseudochryseolinea flava]|uniref:Uncharacterized protein n=1 Tax=Pseudochryseolinea flava TaxID=2059302 RepID=A0A364Y1H4_9BACT|nr:hypothetical protein [Pseudochryseolinea flava]RAW00123.1 hypothetical protein DQQ10_16375 [Pseudochryseolinea flava]
MKRIFYKGIPYESLEVAMDGKKKFALYENNQFIHFVDVEEIDNRSRVSLILDDYYETVRSSDKMLTI